MDQTRPLYDVLPYISKQQPNTVFRLQDETLVAFAQKSLETFMAFNSKTSLPEYAQTIKHDYRRFVFRIHNQNQCGQPASFILKVFPFKHLRHKIQYYWKRYTQSRFGYGESLSLLNAARRGIAVPQVYGYGQITDPLGLIKFDMIMMQDLNNHTEVGRLLERHANDRNQCTEVLKRVTPIFVNLYESGCNNIDMNLGAIMLGNESQTQDRVLDFEYSKFHPQPSLNILMSMSGHFANRCREHIGNDMIEWWFDELMNAIQIDDPQTKSQLKEKFNYYSNHKLSRKRRMRLN